MLSQISGSQEYFKINHFLIVSAEAMTAENDMMSFGCSRSFSSAISYHQS